MTKNGRLKRAGEEFDQLQRDRAARKRSLEKDKEFVAATARVKWKLNSLRAKLPAIVNSFLDQCGYLTLMLRPDRVRALLDEVKNPEAADVLREYMNYCMRFQVCMLRTKRSFRIIPMAPFKHMFHVGMVKGKLRASDPLVRAEREPVYSDLYESKLELPPNVSAFADTVNFVRLEDESGRSVLNEIEAFAYDPERLTFIMHKAQHQYLYCLIGENISTDKAWKQAGKLVTALQKVWCSRSKAGRPSDFSKMKKVIAARRQTRPLKEFAARTAAGTLSKDVATVQSYVSRLAKRMGLPKRTKIS